MKVIRPIQITDAKLTSSSIPEDDYPEWDSGTTYDRGDYVIVLASHTVYRSLTDSNLNNDPDLEIVALADPFIDDPDPVNWQIIGATNRYRMFDGKPSVQATDTTEIVVTLEPEGFEAIFTGLAMLNVQAGTVNVKVGDGSEYDETFLMQDNSVVVDAWTYFFTEIEQLRNVVITDLPPLGEPVTVTVSGGSLKVGQLVIGPVRQFGFVEIGNTGFSGLDFSSVQNDQFGNLTTVQRAATNLHRFDVILNSNQLLGFDSWMRGMRGGQSAVWVGDDDRTKNATAYGFYRNYQSIYQTGEESLISIEIQGVV